MILLDTHVLIWLDAGSQQIGRQTRARMDAALVRGELAVSAITFWEIAMLLEKGRLEMAMDIDSWRRELLESGLIEIPLDGSIGIRAARLQDFHGDPADRIIVATALELSAALVSADEKILSWRTLSKKIDPRK